MDNIELINNINTKLKEGYTVIRIREDLGIGEKALQKIIKSSGYKYNPKLKQYTPIKNNNEIVVLDSTTSSLPKEQIKILDYLGENFNVLVEFMEKYKATTQTTTEATTSYITIDLVDDKHLNPKPKSIRINEFVYRDWQKFCDKQHYSKMDLISMALKEYIEKYNK
ncbi:Uncharacterised protein [[Clostridium] sordellii]|uniref:hypothetical protein n=2 Tax=Paraclostridium sordellii TaxID=1505 RepID=UPI0005E5AE1A|nr:hypothetical protein [Paeniclostridium sordellii]CEQ26531.1 Uncharacterised protein [[Clostridium] sordellii] [Paeniclostridium sordellii]